MLLRKVRIHAATKTSITAIITNDTAAPSPKRQYEKLCRVSSGISRSPHSPG